MINPHKVHISNKEGAKGTVSTGLNTKVSLDGIPLKGIHSVKYEVSAGSVGKLTLVMYAELDIDHSEKDLEVETILVEESSHE